MASDKKEAPVEASPKAKGGGASKILLILFALIAVVACTALGMVLGPQILAGARLPAHAGTPNHGEEAPAEKEREKEKEKEEGTTMVLEPLIVDVRHDDGELHHLKVGIAIEMAKVLPEEELKRLSPRARDAAIAYLRTLSLDEVTSPTKFEAIRAELNDRVAGSLGKSKVRHVLFTDFVAQ